MYYIVGRQTDIVMLKNEPTYGVLGRYLKAGYMNIVHSPKM